MNAEQALLNKVENPDFLSVSGSRLYGTNRPGSDLDIRGFVFPPFEYLLGNHTFNEKSLEGDHKIFSARRFIELALNGDPLITELFFVDKLHCSILTPIAEKVFALKDDIISNKVYSRVLGYSCSEWRKAMGVKQILDKRSRTEDTVVNDIREVFSPDKERMDKVIETLYAGREIKTVPSTAGIGGKRKKEVEKYGYCVSSASHAIRLVDQISELMTTGGMVFPRPRADILKDIKLGQFSKKDVEGIYAKSLAEAESKRSQSVLREKPNRAKVWKEYLKIVSDYIKTDSRFLEFC